MTAGARLHAAFDRIDDFLAVQGAELSIDAVDRLQEAVGVDAEARHTIRERVAALEEEGHSAAAASLLLGIVVGLFAAEEGIRA